MYRSSSAPNWHTARYFRLSIFFPFLQCAKFDLACKRLINSSSLLLLKKSLNVLKKIPYTFPFLQKKFLSVFQLNYLFLRENIVADRALSLYSNTQGYQ